MTTTVSARLGRVMFVVVVIAAMVLLAAGVGLSAGQDRHEFRFDGGWQSGATGGFDRVLPHASDPSLAARLRGYNGGTIGTIPLWGSNDALDFPPPVDLSRCTPRPERGACRQALLEVQGDEDRFDPGAGDLELYARVRVFPDEVRPGMNIVQKGAFGTAGGQWKLQLDQGVPSCRVADGEGVEALPQGTAGIADGRWHNLLCRRRGAVVDLIVDGQVVDSRTAPTLGEVANDQRVTIGGLPPGGNDRVNDPFTGDLDVLVVTIG